MGSMQVSENSIVWGGECCRWRPAIGELCGKMHVAINVCIDRMRWCKGRRGRWWRERDGVWDGIVRVGVGMVGGRRGRH